MKRMKRIMALMLAAIMMMAMSVTAFAAGGATGTHTLTVNVKSTTPAQDLKGQTINLYKLFDVTGSKSGETTNYAYTVNNTYKATLASIRIDRTGNTWPFFLKLSTFPFYSQQIHFHFFSRRIPSF